jgi:DNA-binding MarR family transcriptional regulator
MARWLTDEEQRAWRGLLQMTARLHAGFNRQLVDDHGISVSDYEVLTRLYEAPEPGVRACELQETLVWEQSRLSHQLTRMQRRGLVQRESMESDRRGARFSMTDAGRRAVEEAAPGHVEEVRRLLFDVLADHEVSALANLTARVLARLDHPDEEASDTAN